MTYLDRLALALFTLIALPIAIVPVAFPIAVATVLACAWRRMVPLRGR